MGRSFSLRDWAGVVTASSRQRPASTAVPVLFRFILRRCFCFLLGIQFLAATFRLDPGPWHVRPPSVLVSLNDLRYGIAPDVVPRHLLISTHVVGVLAI
jgi:hypothetical protein